MTQNEYEKKRRKWVREMISFQVGKGQGLIIHREADKRGLSMSEFIRRSINAYVGENIIDAISEVHEI